MSIPASWRAAGRLAGWVLPVLAGLVLAPAPARAECGDYVTTRLSHATAASSHDQPTSAPQPHKPCSGPHCSRAPVAPPAPAPAAPRPVAQEWGCVLDGLSPAAAGPAAPLAEQPAPHPVRLSSAVFHPPRLAY